VTSHRPRVVVDASVVLRRILHGSDEADRAIRDRDLVAPGVLVPEVLSGLVKEMRFRGLALGDAAALLAQFLALPIELVPDRDVAGQTLGLAADLGLTPYDTSYLALAASRDLSLVTADKLVAQSYPRSELIA
jgi:predicted nucleic acid-binding protein